METSFQKIVAAIVGVMILFIIPVYVAFEKADDVSYSLAVKLTQNFVDNVRNKGYISPDMYSDFVAGLYATNNAYDVEIEHVKKRYDPAIYIYEKKEDGSKGELLHVLDYDKYSDQYSNDEITIDVGMYNKTNSTIEVTEPSITLQDGSYLRDENNNPIMDIKQLYKDKIKQYNEQGRIIVNSGEIYADVMRISESEFASQEDIYIPSIIDSSFKGRIEILNKQGNENKYLPYEQYKNAYFNSTGGVFWGPTYYGNDVKYVPASMMISGSEVTAQEAEEMYYEKINEYNSETAAGEGRIIFDKGEVYSESTKSIGYDPEIDMIRNIDVKGTIRVKKPTAWQPNELDFDKYINELRETGKVEYLKAGTYRATKKDGILAVSSASSAFKFDYDTYEDKMLDSSDTIDITAVYGVNDIRFSDYYKRFVVKVINKYTDKLQASVYISDINTLRYLINNNKLSYGTYNYEGDVKFGTEVYKSDIETDYTIEIVMPTFIALDNKLPSTINITGDDIPKYVKEYINNGNITYVKKYEKKDLYFQRAALELADEGIILYRNLNKDKYDEYISNAGIINYRTGLVSVKVDSIVITEEELNVKYTKMHIEGRADITITNSNLQLVEQYYTNKRVRVKEPVIHDTSKFIVQDPHVQIIEGGSVIIDIYEKDNKTLYDEYKKQYQTNNRVTLKYNINDIDCDRARIVIDILENRHDLFSKKTTKIIDDTNTKYVTYLSEYESKGYITIGAATVYTEDQLKVTHPSITIKDPDTDEVITEYKIDFSSDESYDLYFDKDTSYYTEHQIIDKTITYKNKENCYLEKAHVINEEIVTDKQIVAKLFKDTGISKVEFLRECMLGNGDLYSSLAYMNENSYIMNEGDKINVTVKNKNQTIASVFYSLFTANVGVEEIAKIYVDYGGTIKNSGEDIITQKASAINTEEGRLFSYRGQVEEVTLSPGKYKIECWGASGGYSSSITDFNEIGKGAYAKAIFEVDREMTLYVYVGGKGTMYSDTNKENGGFNGGGNAYNAYGGGGATDVRLLRGDVLDEASLLTRIIVAAGGGGSSSVNTGYGGYGGNLDAGIDGNPFTATYRGIGALTTDFTTGYEEYIDNTGATPITVPVDENEKGTFGKGGSVDFDGAGGGGSGYFGGSASHASNAGGGGGVSYIYNNQLSYKDGINYPLTNVVTNNIDTEALETIVPYIDAGKWIGIKNIGTNYISINGKSEMPKGINLGTDTMNGNKGNGYAIIKRCNDEGCED